jgi:anti-anti-sigma factor
MTAAASAAVLQLEGELTIYRAAECKAQLLQALAGNAVLDIGLAGITEIDTAGVQLLLLARREAAARGGRIALVEPSACVQQAIALLALDRHFNAETA